MRKMILLKRPDTTQDRQQGGAYPSISWPFYVLIDFCLFPVDHRDEAVLVVRTFNLLMEKKDAGCS